MADAGMDAAAEAVPVRKKKHRKKAGRRRGG